jgi:hypothetical protein
MSDAIQSWQMVEYEGFEIHTAPLPKGGSDDPAAAERYTYVGYVCHPGANPRLPGHTVPYHADGEETFASEQDASHEAVQVGRSIVDGTHPDLSVLSLVTRGF